MALTVDSAVAWVVGATRGKLAFVGLSVVPDRTNPDVAPAVAAACWYFELTPADFPAVSDGDLASLDDPKRFLDAAKLETLYRIRDNSAFVDQTVEKNSQRLSQFATQLAADIADLESRVPSPNYPRGATGRMPAGCYPFPGPTGVELFPGVDSWGGW